MTTMIRTGRRAGKSTGYAPLACVLLTVCLAFSGTASATDGVYTNGHGSTGAGWYTTGDWLNGIVASGAGAVATFSNVNNSADQLTPSAGGVTVGVVRVVGGKNVTLISNPLTLDNSGASPEIHTASGNFGLRSTLIVVNGYPLIKNGAGSLVMQPDAGKTNSFSAGIVVNAGTLQISTSTSSCTNGTPLGAGSLMLNGQSSLYLARAGGIYAATTNTGATLTFSGMPSINPGTATLTLGAPDAPAKSVLVRSNFGILTLNSSTLGTTARIIVNGGVAVADGMTSLPIMGAGPFLTYDDTVGFTNAAETIGLAGGATAIACVTNATTVGTDASVRALRTSVIVNNAFDLTIDNGVTLTVGDGVNPACVQLGAAANSTYGNIVGNGTLDFGASEGIITFGGTGNNNAKWPAVSCVMAGSGGLTLACRASLGQGTFLIGKNSAYTGPTRILSGAVTPIGNTVSNAFSGDAIYILGNSTVGGQLQFGYFTGTITNTAHVSGVGSAMRWRNPFTKPTGAITFAINTGNSTYAGPVILQGDTRFSAPGSTNNYGLISGPISGNYGVELGYTGTAEEFGTVRFSGTNTYAGTTTISSGVLELLSAKSLAPGPVVVTSDLVFNFQGNVAIANAITGTGRILQRGGGKIWLSNAQGFAGELISQNGNILQGDGPGTTVFFK